MIGQHLRHGALGLALGLSLSLIGFADWGEVHRMFRFADLRMFGAFAFGVALSAPAFALTRRWGRPPAPPLHPGLIPGSVLFGVGWSLTGACPSIGLVQLGEGQLPAAITLAGTVAGVALYARLHGRQFRWDRGTGCG